MQDVPVCFKCVEPVEDPVFEAPCGHDGCRSVVFHGLCLMQFREFRDQILSDAPVVFLVFDPQKFGRF